MGNTIQSGSDAVLNIKLHLVSVTPYRRKILTPQLLDNLTGKHLPSALQGCAAGDGVLWTLWF